MPKTQARVQKSPEANPEAQSRREEKAYHEETGTDASSGLGWDSELCLVSYILVPLTLITLTRLQAPGSVSCELDSGFLGAPGTLRVILGIFEHAQLCPGPKPSSPGSMSVTKQDKECF